MNMKVTMISIVVGALGTAAKGLEREMQEIRDYPDYSIKTGLNTEKCPGDQKRLAVT